MNKKICRITSVILIAAVLMFVFVPSGADAAEQEQKKFRTVRVALVDTQYLSEKQEDGSYQGILVEYLNEISKYAGWELEYVEGPVDELIKKLAGGEVELMGGVLKNDDTMKIYDFPTYSSGSTYGVLVSKKSRIDYIPMDYSSFDGIKVGIYSKSANAITNYESFCRANGLQFENIFYEDSKMLREALDSGEIDAVLTNDTDCRTDEQILARMSVTPYYFAVTRGKSALLRELNNALATLREVSPQFDENLYKKYVLSQQQTVVLTGEEREYIKQREPVRVAVVSGLDPVEGWDRKTQAAVGIGPDILKLIEEYTGLKFEYVRVDTLTQAYEAIESGEADITLRPCGTVVSDDNTVRTKSYLDSQMIRVYNLAPKKSGTGVEAVLEGYHCQSSKEGRNHVFETMKECVEAVEDGRAEYLTFSALLLENYPTLKANKRLYLSPLPNTMGSASFMMQAPANPLLISILDKAISSLGDEEIQEIVYNHTVTQAPVPSFMALYQIYPTEFAWSVAGILFIIAAAAFMLLLLNQARLKLARENVLQEESYRIIGALSGLEVFVYDYRRQRLTLPSAFAEGLHIEKIQKIAPDTKNLALPIQKLLEIFKEGSEDSDAMEFSCQLADGSEAWFRVIGTVMPGPDGEPVKGIGGLRNIQKEVNHLQNLEKQASTDYLTGLYNRQYSEQLIREGECNSGVLFIMDIDHFKEINDKMGHAAGDLILRDFAELLSREFNKEDVVGRWGGDEFIAFVRGMTDRRVIGEWAEQLCRSMNREFVYDGKKTILSISVGGAVADDLISYQELFQRADDALYQVKSTTRNGFRLG